MKNKILGLLCVVFAASVNAEVETIELSGQGSEGSPVIIDVAAKNSVVMSSAKPGKVYLKLINMLPSQRESYVITINQKTIAFAPFERPATPQKTGASLLALDPVCTRIVQANNNLLAATEENKDFLNNMANLRADLKLSETLNNKKCDDSLLKAARATLDATQMNVNVALEPDTEMEIIIGKSGSKDSLGKAVFTRPTQWMTHVGFTFVDNKNDSFYSKQVGSDYVVAEQNRDSDFLYAASVLFTYPYYMTSDHSFGVGVSAGVGASDSDIQLTLGIVSLLFAENFIVTLGGTVMQFDSLKGTYDEGDNLGQASLDSSVMLEKHYKVAPGFTLGYRFK